MSTLQAAAAPLDPYRPPGVLDAAGPQLSLSFDGVVEPEDHLRVTTPTLLQHMPPLLLGSVAATIVIIYLQLIYFSFDWKSVILITMGGVSVICLCRIWYRFVRARSNSRRLCRYPELLGRFRGRISANGIVLESDGGRSWILPHALIESGWFRDSLLVSLSNALEWNRYLVLPDRFFDGDIRNAFPEIRYNCDKVSRGTRSATDLRKLADEFLGPPQAETVYGVGSFRTCIPMTAGEKFGEATGLAALAASLAGGIALAWSAGDIAVAGVLGAGAVIGCGPALRDYLRRFSQGREIVTSPWFAIDDEKWIYGDERIAAIYRYDQLRGITFSDDCAEASLADGRQLRLWKSIIENADREHAWQAIREWAEQAGAARAAQDGNSGSAGDSGVSDDMATPTDTSQ